MHFKYLNLPAAVIRQSEVFEEVFLSLAALTECHILGSLNDKHLLLTALQVRKAKVKGPVDPMFGEGRSLVCKWPSSLGSLLFFFFLFNLCMYAHDISMYTNVHVCEGELACSTACVGVNFRWPCSWLEFGLFFAAV